MTLNRAEEEVQRSGAVWSRPLDLYKKRGDHHKKKTTKLVTFTFRMNTPPLSSQQQNKTKYVNQSATKSRHKDTKKVIVARNAAAYKNEESFTAVGRLAGHVTAETSSFPASCLV